MERVMPTDAAARLLRQAERVVVFTGAGISAESGVPTVGAAGHPASVPDLADEPAEGRRIAPPRCGCGALVRPGVVWFGEALPEESFEAAVGAAANCDLLLTIGTAAD